MLGRESTSLAFGFSRVRLHTEGTDFSSFIFLVLFFPAHLLLSCRWQVFSCQWGRSSLLFFPCRTDTLKVWANPPPPRTVEMLLIHPVFCKVKQWGKKNRLTLSLLESGLFPEGTYSLSKSWLSQTLWRLSSRAAAAANAKYKLALRWKDNGGPHIFNWGWSCVCTN